MYAEWERKTPNFSNKIKELLPIVYTSHHFWAEYIKAKPKQNDIACVSLVVWNETHAIETQSMRQASFDSHFVCIHMKRYPAPFVYTPQWPAMQTHINKEEKIISSRRIEEKQSGGDDKSSRRESAAKVEWAPFGARWRVNWKEDLCARELCAKAKVYRHRLRCYAPNSQTCTNSVQPTGKAYTSLIYEIWSGLFDLWYVDADCRIPMDYRRWIYWIFG